MLTCRSFLEAQDFFEGSAQHTDKKGFHTMAHVRPWPSFLKPLKFADPIANERIGLGGGLWQVGSSLVRVGNREHPGRHHRALLKWGFVVFGRVGGWGGKNFYRFFFGGGFPY